MDVEDEGVARRRDGDRPLRPSVGVIVKLPVHYVGGPAGRRRVPVESRAHAPGQVRCRGWFGWAVLRAADTSPCPSRTVTATEPNDVEEEKLTNSL